MGGSPRSAPLMRPASLKNDGLLRHQYSTCSLDATFENEERKGYWRVGVQRIGLPSETLMMGGYSLSGKECEIREDGFLRGGLSWPLLMFLCGEE